MKLEKFDLEKALNGAKVVTRNGREVSQLTNFENLNDDYPLIGVVDRSIRTWTTQGLFVGDHAGECDEDLFLAVEPKRIWLNVYVSHGTIQTSANYNTLEAAKKAIQENLNYIKTIEITDEL
jgi:hypothetical protein